MPYVALNEVNKLSMSFEKWTISKYESPFLRIVEVPPIAEYNEAFLGHQAAI